MIDRVPGAPVPNTFGLPCTADELVRATDAETVARCLEESAARGRAVTIIGAGSNVVLRRRLPGLVLVPAMKGVGFERLDARVWRVRAAAGEDWPALVRATLGRGIAGLENLTDIPGSAGAAPYQNIGAYGRELDQVVETVEAYDRHLARFVTLAAADCGLRYRDSRFRSEDAGRFVVTAITLRLGDQGVEAGYADIAAQLARAGEPASASAVAAAVSRVRARKLPDPCRIGNAGSFFRNPVLSRADAEALRGRLDIDVWPHEGGFKVPAARLIDAAGWKRRAAGRVGVWPRQPLVLFNRGGATGREVLDLGARIRDDIASKYGVALDMEPMVLGVD